MYRQQPSAADRDTYEQVKNSAPSVQSHPHTYAWFVLLSRFTDAVRNSWAATAQPAAKGGDKKPAAKQEAKKEEPKKEEKPAADDDMDLFGDDDEDDAVRLILNREAKNFNINIGEQSCPRGCKEKGCCCQGQASCYCQVTRSLRSEAIRS